MTTHGAPMGTSLTLARLQFAEESQVYSDGMIGDLLTNVVGFGSHNLVFTKRTPLKRHDAARKGEPSQPDGVLRCIITYIDISPIRCSI